MKPKKMKNLIECTSNAIYLWIIGILVSKRCRFGATLCMEKICLMQKTISFENNLTKKKWLLCVWKNFV